MIKRIFSLGILGSLFFQFPGIAEIQAQCTNLSPASQNNTEPIRTLSVTIVTENGLFSGTPRDVWIDLGPKAWKLTGGFNSGSTRTIELDPNRMGENSGFIPDAVPLYLNDIKFIRLEKKGIALYDIPPPNAEFIALLPIARKIGGITNAPDSLEDFMIPGGATPANLLGDARKALDAADLALNQAQGLLPNLQDAVNKADEIVTEKLRILSTAERKAAELRGVATTKAKDLSNLQNRLNDEGFKFAVRTFTETNPVTKTCEKFENFGFLGRLVRKVTFQCVVNETVTRHVRYVTEAWNALNSTLPGVTAASEAAEAAANLAAAALSPLRLALAAAQAAKAIADTQLRLGQIAVDKARGVVVIAQSKVKELDDFIRDILPGLPEVPKPGQWVPANITLSVNGSEYIRCNVNERLKRGHPSWTGFWESVSPDDQFVNGLRVTNMSESGALDQLASGLTTYLKVQDISGWEKGPIKDVKMIGILRHAPSPGADEYVSLDLQVESIEEINGKKVKKEYILDDSHGIRHPRFIRVEYRHRENTKENDDRYLEWANMVGRRFEVEGKILRDTDRATFYEIHPKKKSNIKVLN
jgi:hypothetical protein